MCLAAIPIGLLFLTRQPATTILVTGLGIVGVIISTLKIRDAFQSSSSLNASPPPMTPPSADDKTLADARARMDVKAPASWLMAMGILHWIAIPIIIIVFVMQVADIQRDFPGFDLDIPNTPMLLALLAALFLYSVIIVAGLKMKRLEAYNIAITGSILAILVSPISLPVGIWALVVLSRREVREAFEANRIRRANSAAPQKPAPLAEAEFNKW
jgi:uncharacterized protein YacL